MYEGFKEFFKDFIEEERQEVRREGLQEGIQEGTEKANERVAVDMLKDGESLLKIKRYSQLSEDAILGLAGNLGLAVVMK